MTEQKFRPGRPKNGEIRPEKKTFPTKGRPRGRKVLAQRASFSLGQAWLELLATISDDLQETRSSIIRRMINRLAERFGFPQAKFNEEEASYRPGDIPSGNDGTFVLGDEHKALLDRMKAVRHRANTGKSAERRLPDGATALLREELDRYAVEMGYEPIGKLIDKVVAE